MPDRPKPTPQQIADELLTARDESRAALDAARGAVEGVVSAIVRRHRAEESFEAARTGMLDAYKGEAEARSRFDRQVDRAVASGLLIEALTDEAAARSARDRAA